VLLLEMEAELVEETVVTSQFQPCAKLALKVVAGDDPDAGQLPLMETALSEYERVAEV
jgi:hypothetical protein